MSKLTRVKLGGVDYKIKYVKGLYQDEDKAVKLDGQIVFSENVIYIEKALAPSQCGLVILHEIVHAIYIHLGVRLDDMTHVSEGHVDAVAYQLYDLLVRNPKLRDAVYGGEK